MSIDGNVSDRWERCWTVQEHGSVMHVIPRNDVWPHRLIGCWCKPTFDARDRALSPVWVHHAKDGREKLEADEQAHS